MERNSVNSGNLINHRIRVNLKILSHTCLAGTVVYKAKRDRFEPYYCNDKYICQ